MIKEILVLNNNWVRFLFLIFLVLCFSKLNSEEMQRGDKLVLIEEAFGFYLGDDLDNSVVLGTFDKKQSPVQSYVAHGKKLIVDPINKSPYFDHYSVTVNEHNTIMEVQAYRTEVTCSDEFEDLYSELQSYYGPSWRKSKTSYKFYSSLKGTKIYRHISGSCNANKVHSIEFKDIYITTNTDPKEIVRREKEKIRKQQAKSICVKGYIRPIRKGWMSSRYGYRDDPFTYKRSFHGGIDLAAKETENAYASEKGIVSFAGEAGEHGNRIEISHSNGEITAYSHLGSILVELGEYVQLGQPIGIVGPTTGRSTGPHVGFEIIVEGKKVNPEKYLYDKFNCTPKYLE